MRYHYLAFNQVGHQIEGELDVADETVVEQILWDQGLTVVQITPSREQRTLAQLFPSVFGVRRSDLIIFSQQLATMLEAGLPILTALELLAEQASKPALQDVLLDVIEDLRQGQPLSAALNAHPETFPSIYTRTIVVGEHTGNLEEVLRRMSIYLEKEEALTRKLRDAMIYPLFVVAVAIFVVILMFTIALPPMIALFDTFDAQLPWPTRFLIGLTEFLNTYGLHLLLGGVVTTAVLGWWSTQPAGRRLRDRLLLRLPLVGRVMLLGQVTRFTHTAAMLIRAGIPLAEVIDLALNPVNNVILGDALRRVRTALLTGRGLARPLSEESVLPSLLAQMVRVGEESGTLEESLVTLTTFYENEMDHKVAQLVAAVEPALTIIVGVLVGFIAVALVLPMYSVLSEIQ
ncbi:MAG: type II secretion system F family protein [Anaerolineae bacterium]